MSKPTKKPKKLRTPQLPDPNMTAFLFVQRLTGQPRVKAVMKYEAPKEKVKKAKHTTQSR